MYTIGGILGQMIASFNICIIIFAYLVVYIKKHKQTRKLKLIAREKQIRKLHQTALQGYNRL